MTKHEGLRSARGHPISLLLAVAGLVACAKDAASPTGSDDVSLLGSVVASGGPAQGNCVAVGGTVYGKHVTSPERAWVGSVLLSFGGAATETATFVDRNNALDVEALLAGRPFSGKETVTVTFPNGDSFDIVADFIGVPASTPALYNLNETGYITNGTGRFADASGHVTVHGPFLSPVFVAEPPWIAAMTGTVCGI